MVAGNGVREVVEVADPNCGRQGDEVHSDDNCLVEEVAGGNGDREVEEALDGNGGGEVELAGVGVAGVQAEERVPLCRKSW